MMAVFSPQASGFPDVRRQYRNAAQATRVSSAWGTASDCDMLLFIIDVHRQVIVVFSSL